MILQYRPVSSHGIRITTFPSAASGTSAQPFIEATNLSHFPLSEAQILALQIMPFRTTPTVLKPHHHGFKQVLSDHRIRIFSPPNDRHANAAVHLTIPNESHPSPDLMKKPI